MTVSVVAGIDTTGIGAFGWSHPARAANSRAIEVKRIAQRYLRGQDPPQPFAANMHPTLWTMKERNVTVEVMENAPCVYVLFDEDGHAVGRIAHSRIPLER